MNFLKLNELKSKYSYGNKTSRIVSRTIAVVLSAALIAQVGTVSAATTNEQVINSFTATQNGQAIINNLKYSDINNSNYALKDAIYQNGALALFPAAGSTKFNPNGNVSKEMALYLVYMAANRAQDINTQGQALNTVRAVKKTNPQAVLYDGSLQLAANDGLITQQELADALQTDQTTLDTTAFKRSASVTRQEFAAWLSKALMIPPVYKEQELLNNFSDWNSIKPENIPYIEAILENNIMSGDGEGKFSPNKAVTREQAVRVLKNAENVILPVQGMEKRTATIEDIQNIQDNSKGYRIDYVTFLVRNSDGLLDQITVESRYQKPTTTSNELTGAAQPSYRTEIPVFKNNQITNSQSLKKGDNIEYITGIDDNIVFYARVLSNSGEISYIAAIVNSVDNTARTMNVTPLKQTIQYPNQDVKKSEKKTYADGSIVYQNYSYANNVINSLTKANIDMSGIAPESIVILGIKQNMITEVVPTKVKEREPGLVAGIVEENNPQLGYLTLYNEDGTGKTPLSLSTLRTFNYADPNDVEVYKNHVEAELDDIEAGDTVFVRIDDTGAVVSVSSVPNYTVRYGTVVSKKISTVLVETNRGQQLTYSVDGADIIKDRKLSKYSQLKEGDKVKLLINEAPNVTVLKEITIEAEDRLIANVYKGTFKRLDNEADKMILSDPWTLRNGKWVKDNASSVKTIELGDDFTAYYGGEAIKNLGTRLADTTVYVASENDYGDGEYGVLATFVNNLDKEVSYDDKVYNTNTNRFGLETATDTITYDEGTIVVKDGRLVQGSSVSADDYAYVVANRDSDTNKIVAGVVSIEERPGTEEVQLYRGRISSIDEYNSVTLESYSKLDETSWDYANTPMTFSLSSNTRITDTDGIIGQGDFVSYGTDTFEDRTVYVLADGTDAVEISTAPYGNYFITGKVISTSGGTIGEDGSQLTQPSTVDLINCKYYNTSTYLWASMKDSSFDFLTNSLILKNNKKINPSELKKGDKIKVLKKDNTVTGDAYVIIVEE